MLSVALVEIGAEDFSQLRAGDTPLEFEVDRRFDADGSWPFGPQLVSRALEWVQLGRQQALAGGSPLGFRGVGAPTPGAEESGTELFVSAASAGEGQKGAPSGGRRAAKG